MTTTAHIDLGAFEHNVSTIVAAVAPAQTWIALKSNAYGHGMLELADNALRAGAHGLAVLDVPAALRLRSHGITATVFAWLHGHETDFAAAVAGDVDLGVSTRDQLESIAAAPGVGKVHLKIDTGLHRNGFPDTEWESICQRARELELSGRIRVSGVWSHLADAGIDSDTAALTQFDRALAAALAAGLTPEFIHVAASSAALRNPDARHTTVRVGIAAYGVSPFDDTDGSGLGMTPVMSLTSTIDSSDGNTSIVATGWFDGVPQQPADGAWVSVAGVQARIVEVAANHVEIDGTFSVGSPVDIIGGHGPTAEQWALWTNTIGDEILTSIPAHVRRVSVRR